MAKRKGKWKIGRILLLVILLAIIGVGIYFGSYIASKLSKLQTEEIDTSDLSVNTDLYNTVSDSLTENEFKDVICIALFGSDARSGDAGRSDSIIIASINTKFDTIKLISIPRDTYVNVPGHGKTKINHAYAYGRETLSIKTINENFGLSITEYATVDFSGLMSIINEIGGIQVDITKSEMEYINTHAPEEYKITGNNRKTISSYGLVTLDGEQALTHSRNRTVGNDFTRAERQRIVLEAIMNKMSKMGATKILAMSDTILQEVKTNINITKYIGQFTDILANSSKYMSSITSIQIPSRDYASGQYIDGTYYFVPDSEKMKEDMIENIYKK